MINLENDYKNYKSLSNTIDNNELTKKIFNSNHNSLRKRNSDLLSEIILIGFLFLIVLIFFGFFYLFVLFFNEYFRNLSTKSTKRQKNSNEKQKNNRVFTRNTRIHKKRNIRR